MAEDAATTIWVQAGPALALVGATVGAAAVAAVAIGRSLDDAEGLVDPDIRAQQAGAELTGTAQSGGRTRLRAEDVIAAQEAQQQQKGPQDAAKK